MAWMMPAAIVGSSLLGAGAAQSAGDAQAGAAGQAAVVQREMFKDTQKNLAPWMDTGNQALVKLSELMGLSSGGPSLTTRGANGTTFNPALLGDPEYLAAWHGIFGGPEQGDSTGWNATDLDAAIRAKLPASYLDKFKTQQSPQSGMLLKPFGMEDFQASPAYQFNLDQGRQAIDKASNARGKYYAPATLQDIGKFSQGLASNEFQNSYNNYNNNMNNIWSRLSTLSGGGQNAAANLGTNATATANGIGNSIMSGGAAQAAGGVGAANALSGGVSSAYNAHMTNQILSNLQQPAYRPQVQGIPGQFNSDTYG